MRRLIAVPQVMDSHGCSTPPYTNLLCAEICPIQKFGTYVHDFSAEDTRIGI